MPRAQIKDEKTYLPENPRKEREQGQSARIANAAASGSRSKMGRKGGKNGYDDWSKPDLLRRAKEIGIRGRSTMSKAELVKALRDH